MKKLALALTAIAAFTGSALAADLPAQTYSKAPVMVAPVPTFTGLWISGGFGYGISQYSTNVTSVGVVPPVVFDPGHDTGLKGWLGKVGVGYDYQFAGPFGQWVVGALADGQWSNIKGQNSFLCPGICSGPATGYTGQLKNDWSWAAGARIGLVVLPGLLTYFNGGYTQADFNSTSYFTTLGTPPTLGPVMGSRRMGGYFLGGGTEYSISAIPGLFWKSEVRFSDFGNRSDISVCPINGVACAPGLLHSSDNNHVVMQAATTELVYRFNWGR
jgi:outer membrane immunogenic protein